MTKAILYIIIAPSTYRRLLLRVKCSPSLRRGAGGTVEEAPLLRREHKHLALDLGHRCLPLPGRRQEPRAERVGHADDGAVGPRECEGRGDARGNGQGDRPGGGTCGRVLEDLYCYDPGTARTLGSGRSSSGSRPTAGVVGDGARKRLRLVREDGLLLRRHVFVRWLCLCDDAFRATYRHDHQLARSTA